MRNVIKYNKFFLSLTIISLFSSIFLLGEYTKSQNSTVANVSLESTVQTEVSIDEDDYESTDSNIFKNITGLIEELFSIGS